MGTFLLSRPQIAWVIVLDDEDNLASVPGGIDSFSINAKDPLKGDAPYLKRWSESLYPKDQKELKKPKGADHGRGNFADWAYYQLGAFVLESSLWSIPVESGEDKGSEEVQRVAWAQATYGGAGYAPWRPFTLPEVGELQVGGWAPLVQVNPPADQLPALVERYHGWLSGMADDFARLQWAEVELKPLDFQEVYQLRARLVNVGPLPSQSAMADVNRRLLPIRVQLELPAGVELLTGRMTQTVGTLAAGGGSEELEWIVRRPAGAAPLSLTAAGPTCGKASQTIE
ncbi:MAG: hypothetical protein R3E96_01280 [Planctomycetota bacterium]